MAGKVRDYVIVDRAAEDLRDWMDSVVRRRRREGKSVAFDLSVSDLARFGKLGEEFGEVSEILYARGMNRTVDLTRLREELWDVATAAAMWAVTLRDWEPGTQRLYGREDL